MTARMNETKTKEKDFVTRLADAGEEALQRIADLPGGQKAVTAVNDLRTRVDELAKKVRGIDELEARVAKLEKELAALKKAGFTDGREERVPITLHWDNDLDACRAMFDGGPAAYPYSLFPDEVKRMVCDEYVKSLAPYRRGDAYDVEAEFVYGVAPAGA